MRHQRLTALILGVLAAALIAPATAGAVNAVSFSPVGNLTIPRDGPGAAPLPDGKILIAGGCSAGGSASCLNTAEIFDPATNTFSAAGLGTMSDNRWEPAAATLPDGRVLVAGGWNGDDLTSADVFDPSTKTFSRVGSMAVPREAAAAAPLPDGRVLVAGGYAQTDYTNTSEIFDPKTNTFTPGPTLPSLQYGAPGAAISGGRVLIAGGYHDPDELASAFAFNSSSSTFSPVGSLGQRRYAPAGASLGDGGALIAGGEDETVSPRFLSSAEVFDPRTNTFSSAGVGNLTHRREEAGAATLPDGRVLVAGGWDGGAVDTAEILNVPSNAFKAKLKGKRVVFSTTNEGTGQVSDVSVKAAISAKKKKKPKLVKTTSKQGGPGKIVVKVKLTKAGNAQLRAKGRIQIRVTYTPDRGAPATKKLKLRARK